MKKILAIAMVLAMVLAITIPVLAVPDMTGPAPKPGYPMWDNIYKGQGAVVDPSVSARTDASGEKIPSNAHSGDVYGLYFYWDDNNKSVLDGTLLVADEFFNLIKGEAGARSFTVTAKNSNAYWDYEIVEGQGNVLVENSGVSAYKIPRFFMYCQSDKKTGELVVDKKTGLPVMVKDELKNINMIFIDGDWIDGYVIIEKVWLDEDGVVTDGDNDLVSFNKPYVLGENTIEIASLSGATVTVSEKPIAGFTTLKNPISVKVKPGEEKTITFTNQKQYATIEIVKIWLDVNGDEIKDAAILAELNAAFAINGDAAKLGVNKVREGAYTVSETECPAGYTLVSENDVEVTVAAGEKATVTFINQEDDITIQFGAEIEKWIDGQWIVEWDATDLTIYDLMDMMSFKLYKVDGSGGDILEENFVADGELLDSGVISFGNLNVEGWYAVVENLSDDGKLLFVEANPMYVYIGELGVYEKEPIAWVSGIDFGTPVIHDGSGGVNWALPNVWDGVLAGQPAYEMLKNMGAKWVWDVEDTYIYGVSGSVYTETFEFHSDEEGVVTGYLAADNAAVVYVNGKLAGFTAVAFNTPGNQPAAFLNDFDYGALDAAVFDGGWATGWNYSYSFDIEYLAGKNTVTIIAANSARTDGTGTANDSYDTTNNPCGVIFGFITPPVAVFNNYTVIPPQYGMSIEKWVDNEFILDWAEAVELDIYDLIDMMSFDLYKFNDETDEWVWLAEGTLINEGIITFGNIEDFDPGRYKLVETLIGAGLNIFEETEPYFFTVADEDFAGVFENTTIPPVDPTDVYDKIPSKQHSDRWWANYGIIAYGASSNQDKYDYYIAFSEDFWDNNASVTIGFGTKGKWTEAVIYLDADGNLACDTIDFENQQDGGNVFFGNHYTGKSSFDISVGAYYDNPYGAGAKQLWLLTIQPK